MVALVACFVHYIYVEAGGIKALAVHTVCTGRKHVIVKEISAAGGNTFFRVERSGVYGREKVTYISGRVEAEILHVDIEFAGTGRVAKIGIAIIYAENKGCGIGF